MGRAKNIRALMTSDLVENYFKSIGIRRAKSQAVFEKHGRQRFGKAFEQLRFIVAQRESGVESDPYEIKNSSLDLSLYVGEYHTSGMWREFASWLVRENLPSPSEVLDLGCENGVLTCFYASPWPDAKVVGVERSQAAVSAAGELAKRLGLANVSFERADARHFLDANPGRFQIILATLVMHEFLKGPAARKPFKWDGEYERIEDVILMDADLHAVEALKAVGKALADDGLLISLDRSPNLASKWWYAQCVEKAGMKVSLTRCHSIECQGVAGSEIFPITVSRFAREGEPKTTPAEIVSLSSFREFSALKMHFREDLADTFVRSIGPAEIMFDAVCEYLDGSGIRTIRLLKAPALLVLHDFTNHGYQTASIAPLVALPEVLGQCRAITSQLEAHCTVQQTVTDAAKLWLSRLDYPIE
jgi:SAM-dependent methyltransferase